MAADTKISPAAQAGTITLGGDLTVNRLGFGAFTGFQLKIVQEAITVAVFIVFAITFLKEKMAWNYAISFALLIAAVVVAFAFKPGAAIG